MKCDGGMATAGAGPEVRMRYAGLRSKCLDHRGASFLQTARGIDPVLPRPFDR